VAKQAQLGRNWFCNIVGQVGNLPPIIKSACSGRKKIMKWERLSEASIGRFANRRQVANLPYKNKPRLPD
jgi:hypothetical protein